jgi:hypothetical protein
MLMETTNWKDILYLYATVKSVGDMSMEKL